MPACCGRYRPSRRLPHRDAQGIGRLSPPFSRLNLATRARTGAKFLGETEETAEEVAGRPVMDESILGDIPNREAVDAILKEIQDAVPHVSEDELRDTRKRRIAIDKNKDPVDQSPLQ